MSFVYATTPLQEADFVIIGVSDETGSHAVRSGSRRGPEAFRKVAKERCVFKRKGRFSLAQIGNERITQKIHDYGDIPKKKIKKVVEVLSKDKIPIVIGGDHSITTEIIKGLDEEITIIYFDAHPDIVSSMHGYYGSVLSDIEVYLGKTIEIGIREPEIEELKNIKKKRVHVVYAKEFVEKSLLDIWKGIKENAKGKVYVSIDLDVFDPAYAPGVSTPVPGGLNYNQVVFLIEKIMEELEIIGFDIMELNPRYDKDEMTAHLAVKLILEMIIHTKPKTKPAKLQKLDSKK